MDASNLKDGQGFIDLNTLSLSVQIDGALHQVRYVAQDEIAVRVGNGPETVHHMPLLANTRQEQIMVWLMRGLRGIPQFYAARQRAVSGVRA